MVSLETLPALAGCSTRQIKFISNSRWRVKDSSRFVCGVLFSLLNGDLKSIIIKWAEAEAADSRAWGQKGGWDFTLIFFGRWDKSWCLWVRLIVWLIVLNCGTSSCPENFLPKRSPRTLDLQAGERSFSRAPADLLNVLLWKTQETEDLQKRGGVIRIKHRFVQEPSSYFPK